MTAILPGSSPWGKSKKMSTDTQKTGIGNGGGGGGRVGIGKRRFNVA